MLNTIVSKMPPSWVGQIKTSAIADQGDDPPSVHFWNKSGSETVDIVSTNTRIINKTLCDRGAATPTGLEYWRDQFGDSDLNIPFCTCFGGLKENYMGQIDYFLAHNVLFTNDKLLRCGLATSNLCTFCSGERESAFHIFIECGFVQETFMLVWDICQTILGNNMDKDYFIKYVLFGFLCKDKKVCNLINFVLTNYRATVWNARKWLKKGQRVSLKFIFSVFIRKRIELELQGHMASNTLDVFLEIFGINEALIFDQNGDTEIAFS
jgi:hypothetical protein